MKQRNSFLPLSSTYTFIFLLVLISFPPILVSSPKSKFNFDTSFASHIIPGGMFGKWHHCIIQSPLLYWLYCTSWGSCELKQWPSFGDLVFASYSRSCTYCFCGLYTPPKTHMSPEQWCLKKYFPLEMVPFQVMSYISGKVPTSFLFAFCWTLIGPSWPWKQPWKLRNAQLPFAVPKLRRFLGAPYVPMKRHAVEARLAWGPKLVGDGDVWWFSNDFFYV